MSISPVKYVLLVINFGQQLHFQEKHPLGSPFWLLVTSLLRCHVNFVNLHISSHRQLKIIKFEKQMHLLQRCSQTIPPQVLVTLLCSNVILTNLDIIGRESDMVFKFGQQGQRLNRSPLSTPSIVLVTLYLQLQMRCRSLNLGSRYSFRERVH